LKVTAEAITTATADHSRAEDGHHRALLSVTLDGVR
jgi:hypothetical protein